VGREIETSRPELTPWVSDSHPQKLACKRPHEGGEQDCSGSYDWMTHFVFDDEEWQSPAVGYE
jgi:hypothetical protein